MGTGNLTSAHAGISRKKDYTLHLTRKKLATRKEKKINKTKRKKKKIVLTVPKPPCGVRHIAPTLPSTHSIPSLGRLSPAGHAHPLAAHPSMPPHWQYAVSPDSGIADGDLKGHPGHPPLRSIVRVSGQRREEGLIFYLGCSKQPKKQPSVIPLFGETAHRRLGDMREERERETVVVYICTPR